METKKLLIEDANSKISICDQMIKDAALFLVLYDTKIVIDKIKMLINLK